MPLCIDLPRSTVSYSTREVAHRIARRYSFAKPSTLPQRRKVARRSARVYSVAQTPEFRKEDSCNQELGPRDAQAICSKQVEIWAPGGVWLGLGIHGFGALVLGVLQARLGHPGQERYGFMLKS